MIAKTIPHIEPLFEEVYSPDVIIVDDEIHVTNNMHPDVIEFLEYSYGKDVVIRYVEKIPICEICGGELARNGTVEFNLNNNRIIKKQKYYCKNKVCKRYHTVNLELFIPKWSNYTYNIQSEGLIIGGITYTSFEKKSEIISYNHHIHISRQTAWYHTIKRSESYLLKKEEEIESLLKEFNIEPSGFYHYDEQVLWVNTGIYFRMTILDAKTNMIINEKVIKREIFDKTIIDNFLKYSLEDLPLTAIITDGDRSYPSIIDALGAIHQQCIFHKMQNLMKPTYKKLKALYKRIRNNDAKVEKLECTLEELKVKNTNKKGRISKEDKKAQKIVNKIRIIIKKIKELKIDSKKSKKEIDELELNVKRISLIFKSTTVESAKRKFNTLYNKVEYLPPQIRPFIKNLYSTLDRTLNHIINDSIPNTNNKLEGYYKITLPRYMKKIYRTEKGLNIQLRLNRIRWIERNVIKQKINSTS